LPLVLCLLATFMPFVLSFLVMRACRSRRVGSWRLGTISACLSTPDPYSDAMRSSSLHSMGPAVGLGGSSYQSHRRGPASSEDDEFDSELEAGVHGTSSGRSSLYGMYGSASLTLDASDYKNKQRYIARCIMCKENITNAKGVAYHSAGFVLVASKSYSRMHVIFLISEHIIIILFTYAHFLQFE
jgi:hypothetical protein